MKINLYQIETTNYCNAKCSFCPSRKMTRKKGKMDIKTFHQCMKIMKNDYCALHHFGEPFMNVLLPNFIKTAHMYGKEVEFSTNGGVSDIDMIRRVMEEDPYIIRIAYDYFKPDDFIRKILVYNEATFIYLHAVQKGLLCERKPFNNFAGAVRGESEISRGDGCYFKKYNYFVSLWDGKIVPCCQDYDGKYQLGTIWDKATVKHEKNYDMCKACTGMQFAMNGLWKTQE